MQQATRKDSWLINPEESYPVSEEIAGFLRAKWCRAGLGPIFLLRKEAHYSEVRFVCQLLRSQLVGANQFPNLLTGLLKACHLSLSGTRQPPLHFCSLSTRSFAFEVPQQSNGISYVLITSVLLFKQANDWWMLYEMLDKPVPETIVNKTTQFFLGRSGLLPPEISSSR